MPNYRKVILPIKLSTAKNIPIINGRKTENNIVVYNEIRKQIYDQFVEEYGWDFIEEIPDDMIYAEINDQDDIDYQYFKDKFTQLLKNGYCLLVGTCGRWNGSVRGGKFIASFDDLYNAIQHLD